MNTNSGQGYEQWAEEGVGVCQSGAKRFLNALSPYLLALEGRYEGVFKNTNDIKCTHVIYECFEYKF